MFAISTFFLILILSSLVVFLSLILILILLLLYILFFLQHILFLWLLFSILLPSPPSSAAIPTISPPFPPLFLRSHLFFQPILFLLSHSSSSFSFSVNPNSHPPLLFLLSSPIVVSEVEVIRPRGTTQLSQCFTAITLSTLIISIHQGIQLKGIHLPNTCDFVLGSARVLIWSISFRRRSERHVWIMWQLDVST